MEKNMDNEVETGIVWGSIGDIVLTPSIPPNSRYNTPLENPLHNPFEEFGLYLR